jgi:hypothetical protein
MLSPATIPIFGSKLLTIAGIFSLLVGFLGDHYWVTIDTKT